MKAIWKISCWFVFFLLAASSCLDEPDCFALNNNIVGIAFKKMSDNKADTVFVARLTATGTDSVFLESSTLTGINLPLNFLTERTTFVFEDHLGIQTLDLTYDSKPQFVSEDCGERFVIGGLEGFSDQFDSIRVVSASPKRAGAAGNTIEIFRCPNRRQVKLRFLSAVEIQSIELAGNYSNDVLFTTPTTILKLPLDINSDQSTIRLTLGDGTPHELVLSYVRERQTVYSACGEQVYLSGLDIVSHTFANEPVLADTTFTDPPKTNIAITL